MEYGSLVRFIAVAMRAILKGAGSSISDLFWTSVADETYPS